MAAMTATTTTTTTTPDQVPSLSTNVKPGSDDLSLLWWNSNLPKQFHTTTCPDYLGRISPKNKRILSSPDYQATRMSWDEICRLITTNQLGSFERSPVDMRYYMAFMHSLRTRFDNPGTFVMRHRLGWIGDSQSALDKYVVQPRGRPFEFADDIKILRNDWPYHIDERVVHLVVWTKFDLPDAPGTERLCPELARDIEKYIDENFRTKFPAENITWFRNWRSIRSIPAVDHFHIMILNPDLNMIEEIIQESAGPNSTKLSDVRLDFIRDWNRKLLLQHGEVVNNNAAPSA